MNKSPSHFCPLCVLALLGLVVLLGVPGLASVQTPLGPASVLVLWIPLLSALLRQGMLRTAGRVQRPAAARPRR
jgi:hypothetical protein